MDKYEMESAIKSVLDYYYLGPRLKCVEDNQADAFEKAKDQVLK